MKRFLSIVALVGLSGLGINLAAQTSSQTPSQAPSTSDSQASPSTQAPSATSPNSSMPQSQTDTSNAQQSARAFEGRIQKSGDEFVLQESATQTSYKLDDQEKVAAFVGKQVKITGKLDMDTNTIHVDNIELLS